MSRPISTRTEVACDVETAWGLLTGPGWPAAQDAALHDGSQLLSREETPDGGVVLVFSRRLPDGIPGFMQKFVPADGRVTQTDRWGPARDGERHATWSVGFPGSPGEMGGTTALVPTADGCAWTVDGTVKVRIPVVGGKVEGFLAPLVEKLLGKQADVLRGQLG